MLYTTKTSSTVYMCMYNNNIDVIWKFTGKVESLSFVQFHLLQVMKN